MLATGLVAISQPTGQRSTLNACDSTPRLNSRFRTSRERVARSLRGQVTREPRED